MITIRLSPDSPTLDALCICYENKRLYRHGGQEFMVQSIDIVGRGKETRLQAELVSPFEALEELQC